MKNMKSYLFLLFIILGCTSILGNSSDTSYILQYRLNETENYQPISTLLPEIKHNIELNFKGNKNELTFVLDDVPIPGENIIKVIEKTSTIKILKRDRTFLKQYVININKNLESSTYAPLLMGENNNEVVRIVENSNSLPTKEESFNSNIIEVFIKDEFKELLKKRFKKIYYIDTSSDNYDLDNKANAKEINVSVNEIVNNNYPIRVTKDKLGGDLGLKLYGLEYFKDENKENLIPIGNSLLTSVNLPWITFSDDLGNITTIKLDDKAQNISGKIGFRPNEYKLIGFKGKVDITYKTKEGNIITSFTKELEDELFKPYRKFEEPNPIENINVGKIEFRFVYNENSNYTKSITIPNVILKYRLDDKQDNYSLLSSNTQMFDQNIELILEGEDGDLYVDNKLINKLNEKTSAILKNPINNIKIKSKINDGFSIILRECNLKIEKDVIESSYVPILIKKEGENLSPLKDDLNVLPNKQKGFNSNILEVFIKDSVKELLKKRIKKLYYIDTSSDDYNFNSKVSAKECTESLENIINNGLIITKNKLNGDLGIKLYGLEYFEDENDKENLISLGNELVTTVLAPLITLEDELGNIVTINMNEALNLSKSIEFSPTKFRIVGFNGNLEVNYKDGKDASFRPLYKAIKDNKLFKEFENFNFLISPGTVIKEIQFKFSYNINSSFTTTIKSPSFVLKYKSKDNEAYQSFDYNSNDIFNQNIKLLVEGNETDLYILDDQETKVAEQNGELSSLIKNTTNFKLKPKGKDNLLKLFKVNVLKQSIGSSYYPYLVKTDGNFIVSDQDEDNVLTPGKFKGNLLRIAIKESSKEIIEKRIKNLYYVDTSIPNYNLEDKKMAKLATANIETLINDGYSVSASTIGGQVGLKLYGLEYFEELGENQQNLLPLGDNLLTMSSNPAILLENGGSNQLVDGIPIEEEIDVIPGFKPTSCTIGGFKGDYTLEYEVELPNLPNVKVVTSKFTSPNFNSLSENLLLPHLEYSGMIFHPSGGAVKTIIFNFYYNSQTGANQKYTLRVITP